MATIGCCLPFGITIGPLGNEDTRTFTLAGPPWSLALGAVGVGLTVVDDDWWADYAAANPNSPLIATGILWNDPQSWPVASSFAASCGFTAVPRPDPRLSGTIVGRGSLVVVSS